MKWGHNQLAEDLAIIKGTNFLDVPLGSVWLQNAQRADVLEVKPSYTRFCVSIYEIKVSRADFLSDIRSEKWKGYLDHCHRFYFAVPSGMVKKDEIPGEAGLIIRGETGWSTLKAAKKRDVEIPSSTLLSLVFSNQRLNHSHQHRERIYKALREWSSDKKLYKELGKKVGDALRNFDKYDAAKKDYEWELKEVRESIKRGLGVEYCAWPLGRLDDLVEKIKRKAEEKHEQ